MVCSCIIQILRVVGHIYNDAALWATKRIILIRDDILNPMRDDPIIDNLKSYELGHVFMSDYVIIRDHLNVPIITYIMS